MSHPLIDHNDDLRLLREEGYNVSIHAAHLVVRDVPYVSEERKVLYDGILVTTLDLNGDSTGQPSDHTIRFAGQNPCTADGVLFNAIRPNSDELRISDKLTTQFHFSAKPPRGHYQNYHEKIKTYVGLLSGQATRIDPDASARTRQVVEPDEDDDSPFHYLDTASARAEINIITAKLAAEKIAIVGLGGTGSYILDMVAKVPIKEIHLFDGDTFESHNSFRAPGAASIDQLRQQPSKVEYFSEIYSRMHRGIISHNEYLDETNIEQLREMSCVFLSMDAGPSKEMIVEKLEEFGITFFDTGMGLYTKRETVGGILQVTSSTLENRETARNRISFVDTDEVNEYDKNIQVADLNALNAILAVIRWKKLRGFYFDFKNERYSSYTVGTNQLLNEDIHEQT